MKTCEHCGKEVKKDSQCSCQGCFAVIQLFKKRLATPKKVRERAVKQMYSKPQVVNSIFHVR